MAIVTTSSRKRKSSKTPLFIILLVVVFAAAAYFIFRDKGITPADPEQVAVPQPKPAPTNVVASEPETRNEKPETQPSTLNTEPSTNAYVKKAGQMQLPSGKILTFPPPKEGETVKVLANGKIYECDSEGNWRDTTPRKIFHGAFESNFANLAMEGRSFIPAFLIGLDKDAVLEVLKKDYVLQGDETEEEMAQINAYIEMKGVALDYIEQGGTFDEFVTEMAAFVQAERKVRANSLKQVMMLYKEGKLDDAKAKYEALNAVLAEQGYKAIKLPPHVKKAFGIEE